MLLYDDSREIVTLERRMVMKDEIVSITASVDDIDLFWTVHRCMWIICQIFTDSRELKQKCGFPA